MAGINLAFFIPASISFAFFQIQCSNLLYVLMNLFTLVFTKQVTNKKGETFIWNRVRFRVVVQKWRRFVNNDMSFKMYVSIEMHFLLIGYLKIETRKVYWQIRFFSFCIISFFIDDKTTSAHPQYVLWV